MSQSSFQHVYIIGAKSIGLYGGFESFLLHLLERHKDHARLRYHVACKKNSEGCMDVQKLPGAVRVNDSVFTYGSVRGFLVRVPEVGAAQAISYDLKALRMVCEHIEQNRIMNPVLYILASRIGPFEKPYVKRIHAAGGVVFHNPDGHEHLRKKWNALIRRYWKLSERFAVKNADLVVCDSKNMESYIRKVYAAYRPKTTYIAYGADVAKSVPSVSSEEALSTGVSAADVLSEEMQSQCSVDAADARFLIWKKEHNLSDSYYISVGRFVKENNFEIMIREFMNSHTEKDFALITTENSAFADELQQKLRFRSDQRIKFVGTVYDAELLKKIREHAYGYLHGHEVGGTNPSLLESLASTNLNLILGVSFNREVAEDTALYWNKEEGSLSSLIDRADEMTEEEVRAVGNHAKDRIREHYSWEKICAQYEKLFLSEGEHPEQIRDRFCC